MEWRSFVKRSVSSTRRTSRKSLLHFIFFSRKLVLVACGFIISSNRVDFRKSYFLIFISVIINSSYFAVLNTIAHLRSYEVEKAIWFESNEQSCLDSVTLRVRVRVPQLVKPLHFLPSIHSFQSSWLLAFRTRLLFFVVCTFRLKRMCVGLRSKIIFTVYIVCVLFVFYVLCFESNFQLPRAKQMPIMKINLVL